jgi:hypothetical protein
MAVSVQREPALPSPRPQAVPTAKAKPVYWWAVLGAGFVALQMYIHIAWILSDDFRHVGTGVTPVPLYMQISARGNEIFWFSFMLAVIYFLAIRPWRRSGKLTLDGMFVLAFYFTWWQDPLFNYINHAWNYSSVSVNMGGWAGHIPGWISPNGGNIPEPLLWVLPFYVGLGACAAVGFSAMMRRWRVRNPQVSLFKMLATVYACCFLFDFALEFFWVRTGLYTYAGTTNGWTIFSGEWYQFPIFEPICVGFLGTGWVVCRYFVNDRGETIAERGASRLGFGGKQRTLTRFLAVVGILNVSFLITYSLLTQAWNLHSGDWPRDAQERSYLTNGLCGAGTSYSCGGSSVSIPRAGKSVHIGPDGKLVVPRGTTGEIVAPPLSTTKK